MPIPKNLSGGVCGRRHRDALCGGGARVLHQGGEQQRRRWEEDEEERHCALAAAGWREDHLLHTVAPEETLRKECLPCMLVVDDPSPHYVTFEFIFKWFYTFQEIKK